MGINFSSIIPWGRSFNEYKKMFGLTKPDLRLKILGCGDGPASFNVEMKEMGFKVTSIDPIYKFSKEQIQQRIKETSHEVVKQVKMNIDKYIWNDIKNVEELYKIRMEAMNKFLDDYNNGKIEKRYICAELPVLLFVDDQFDLTLCSHLLFLFSDKLNLEFHIKSINEILRISKEARIFPIVDFNSKKSEYLQKVIEYFENKNYKVIIEKTDYEFFIKANEFMRVRKE